MSSRTVKSLAGRNIEIVEDNDWMLTTGSNAHGLRQFNGSKPLAIRYLWEHGVVRESNGRATAVLHAAIHEEYKPTNPFAPSALSMVMNDPQNAPAFARKINGKRCYAIDLVAMPESWYKKLTTQVNGKANADAAAVFAAIPVTANGGRIEAPPIVIERDERELITPTAEDWIREESLPQPIEAPQPIEEYAPPLEIEIASQVAMELLTKVVEIIAAGTPESANREVLKLTAHIAEVEGRLAARLDENGKLRRQRDELADEVKALRYERDGLRQRLRNTESNLTAALRGETAQAVNGEIMRRVDRIMREAPKPKGE